MARFLTTLAIVAAGFADPVWSIAGPPPGVDSGLSVATAGDVNGDGFSDVIVGSPHDDNGETLEGRVFVYHGSPAGLLPTPAWSAEGNQPGAEFGCAVATAGDVNGDGFSDVIIGARNFDAGEADEGRAFVYLGSPTGLSNAPAWVIEGNQAGAQLGGSVAPAGDVNGDGFADIIVGAPLFDDGNMDEGRAFVFHGSPTGLAAAPSWTADGNQSGALFGASVATAGDVNGDGYADVIVGGPGHIDGQPTEGRAWVFHGSPSGVSAAPAWTADGNQDDARFGTAVFTAGDVNGDGFSDVIVGASAYDGDLVDEGRVFVYHGAAGGVSVNPAWTAEGNQAGAAFGCAVAGAGDVNGDGYCDVVIGASGFDTDQSNAGRVAIFHGSPAGLGTQATTSINGDTALLGLGNAVAAAGDVDGDGYADVVYSALGHDNPQPGAGGVWIHHGAAAGIAAVAGWLSESNQTEAWHGWSVASAGDVNGDGFGDIIVGSLNYDNGETNEGAAFVYYGSATGPSATPDWMAEGNQSFAEFGYAVGTAGDVNGDGYDDVIVGSPQFSNGESAEGRAWLYLGSPTGPSTSAAWTAESNQIDGRMGRLVASAGDVNADGYADVLIGAYSYSNGEQDEGIALVFHGSPNGLGTNGTPQTADWMTEGNQPTAWYGRTGGTAGDVNGDGFSDVIVSSYRYSNGQAQEGAAFVYHGSPTGLSSTPDWIAESNQVNATFGFSAGTAGDVNGDGYSDVIVGAVSYFGGLFWEGAAFVYAGSVGGLGASPLWTTEGNQVEARLGWASGTAADVNGDGFGDILVSSYLYDNDQVNEGRVFVYHGSPSGPGASPAGSVDGNQTAAQFGYAAASAGDVNGDGYGDIVIGAYAFDGGQSNEGRATLHYGNQGPCVSLVPRQRRISGSAPIAHLGRSDSTTAMSLAAIGRTPFGRGRVKIEWEIKPVGVPLDGTSTQQSAAFTDTGISGVALPATPMNLTCGTPYHWSLRLRYDPTALPFAQHSRWVHTHGNSRQESDLRTPPIVGDMNCDCNVNQGDVLAFITALLDPAGYAAAQPLCGPGADMQPDGQLDGGDIAALLALLTGD